MMEPTAPQSDLVRQITAEVCRRLQLPVSLETGACQHASCLSHCSGCLQLLLDCGACRVGVCRAAAAAVHELAGFIDHTLLKPEATETDVLKLCREAVEQNFAAVCINPAWVRLAAEAVRGSRVVVCSVVGFPLGVSVTDAKVYETRRAVFDGAGEIDMVIHIGALKSGKDALVRKDIQAVADACREMGAHSKVIIEAALLNEEEKVKACLLAREAGADFVKTSTGFGPGGATVQDVQLMRRVVGPEMGIKAAGGIRDQATTRAMIEAGATRIGASASLKIVQNAG